MGGGGYWPPMTVENLESPQESQIYDFSCRSPEKPDIFVPEHGKYSTIDKDKHHEEDRFPRLI